MHASIDALIARLALSLWTSAKRIERLPTVTVVQPWERACFIGRVLTPAQFTHAEYAAFCTHYEGI